jgi:hypothetical protein
MHRIGHGRKAVVLLGGAEALKGVIRANPLVAGRVVGRRTASARLGAAAPKGSFGGLVLLPMISWLGTVDRMRLIADARRVIASEGKRLGWSRTARLQQLADVADPVTLHVSAVRKAAASAFYERLVGLWHVFHVPLFFFLVIAAIIHIFAAHFF